TPMACVPTTPHPTRGIAMLRALLAITVVLVPLVARAEDSREALTFEKDVRAILKTHCWHCHGEANETEGGLDTRLARLLVKGGDTGPAIVAGQHAESLLYQRIAAGEMPPEGKMLSAAE